MMSQELNLTHIGLAASVAIVFVALGCQDSNSLTGPTTSMAPPAASIAGSWSGTFVPDDSTGCGSSSASATFQQIGATVTGNLATSKCGVAGYFSGTIQGNTITGTMKMAGCVGGGVSGTISASEVSLSIGDLTKPLIMGQTAVVFGGAVRLHR